MTGVLLTQYDGNIVGPIAWLLGKLMNGIFWILNAIGLPNIGLSIILFTIVIYLCLTPLTYKQQKFSKLQSKMSPELQAIQAKYKGKKDNDSMMLMQQETKEVYAKYGVSQTGSCLQLVVQMPILFALYRVIYAIPAYVEQVKNAFFPLVDELRNTSGATEFLQSLSSGSQFKKNFESAAFVSGDVSTVQNTYIDVLNRASTADWTSLGDKFPNLASSIEATHEQLIRFNNFLGLNIGDTPMYTMRTAFSDKQFLLLLGALMVPVLAALTQWINVKLMPQTANTNTNPDDPSAQMQQSMKTMNTIMPLMSAVFCLSLPAGMGIYWIAGAVVRTIQQILINKHIDRSDIDAEIEKNVAKYKEKMEKSRTTKAMNSYASLSTKSMDLSTLNSGHSDKDKEKNLENARQIYNGKEIRKDSLLAKANMVKDFNEKNNK